MSLLHFPSLFSCLPTNRSRAAWKLAVWFVYTGRRCWLRPFNSMKCVFQSLYVTLCHFYHFYNHLIQIIYLFDPAAGSPQRDEDRFPSRAPNRVSRDYTKRLILAGVCFFSLSLSLSLPSLPLSLETVERFFFFFFFVCV